MNVALHWLQKNASAYRNRMIIQSKPIGYEGAKYLHFSFLFFCFLLLNTSFIVFYFILFYFILCKIWNGATSSVRRCIYSAVQTLLYSLFLLFIFFFIFLFFTPHSERTRSKPIIRFYIPTCITRSTFQRHGIGIIFYSFFNFQLQFLQ